MKVKVWDPRYLEYFNENCQHPKQNLKLKSKKSLEEFLDVTKTILSEGPTKWYGNTDEMFAKLQRMKEVLEHEVISGVNRKLQMKPEKWVERQEIGLTGKVETITKVSHVLIILKWGGILTPLGELQSENLGTLFRTHMYPDPSGGGVLRLHSTFRHDLKIKSSDEGRVMKTAAAFTKGLLELEGDLTPVLVSLVSIQDSSMLDHSDNQQIKEEMEAIKLKLSNIFQQDYTITPDMLDTIAPIGNTIMRESLLKLKNPRRSLQYIYTLISQLCQEIKLICQLSSNKNDNNNTNDNNDNCITDSTTSSSTTLPILYLNETPYLMLYRWETLYRDFYTIEKDTYDLSKVPELHDMTRYDLLHNSHLPFSNILDQLYEIVDTFASCIVPQEYGITLTEKQKISHMMCDALLKKISNDILIARSDNHLDMHYLLDHSHGEDLDIRSLGRNVRTRLYFTSESHLYTLLNVLQYPLDDVTSSNSSSSRASSSISTTSITTSTIGTNPETTTSSPLLSTPPLILTPATSTSTPTNLFDEKGNNYLNTIAELGYLTQITIRLFEVPNKSKDDPDKYRCEISFSCGGVSDPRFDKLGEIADSVILNENVRCDDVLKCLAGSLDLKFSDQVST